MLGFSVWLMIAFFYSEIRLIHIDLIPFKKRLNTFGLLQSPTILAWAILLNNLLDCFTEFFLNLSVSIDKYFQIFFQVYDFFMFAFHI
jgi:hypothetical protein